MSQHDYVIDNQSFPATRTDLNNALSAIVSQNSGASAPSTTYAYQLWYDTTNNTLKMRNSDNDAWIDLFDVNQTTDVATIAADGSGDISLGNFKFDSDQTVGAGQDDYVLTYDNTSGKISLEAAAGGGASVTTGTFTPAFSSTSATDQDASIISAYDTQAGFYTRIGDLVHIELTITTNSSAWSYTNGGANAQSLTIVGLPFTIKNTTGYFPSISVGYFNTWTNWSASYTPMGYGNTNTKRIVMTYAALNGVLNLLTSYIATVGSSIIVSMTYETDDA